ncbi:MAG: translation initiation factor IF-2 subunit alpha [Candidatus Micrarchaeota archaeon]
MPIYPQQGEIVIATVKKITTFGAFCSLDEFKDVDAFVHISEVSSGWVRSVRDYVKEGQKIVALVLRVDDEKRQIDLSLKRIGEGEKKRKMEVYNLDKRAVKLLERVAIKLGKKPEAVSEVVPIIRQEYGDLYTIFENASEGKEISKKLTKPWVDGITVVAKAEIKPKVVTQRAILKLKCFAPDGVEQVKKTLASLNSLNGKEVKIEVRYIGAPKYFVDISAPDYKAADKVIAKIQTMLDNSASELMDFQIEKSDKK